MFPRGMGQQSKDVEPRFPNPTESFSKWFDAVLSEAELVDVRYGVKGFIVYRPFLMRIIKQIYALFERELEEDGHEPALFPLVIPRSYLSKESEHIKGFEGEVFWVTKRGHRELEEPLALRPTSETAIYPMYALWISGKSDLPLKIYQSVAVYRAETKATRPLLRGREFLWVETHDVFATKEEAYKQVERDVEIFERVVWEKLGIPFLHFKREEFDKFAGAEESFAFDTLLPDGNVLQIGTTHYLGTNFSRAFEIKFLDEDGVNKYVHQTCFGIGISRIAASIIAVHGDEFGLRLPFWIAPVQIVIVPIPKKGLEAKIDAYCKELKEKLSRWRVVYDDSDNTPGEKFYRWDTLGVPIRVEVGPKELETKVLTLFRRDKRERLQVPETELLEAIPKIARDILETLKAQARERLEAALAEAKTREDFEAAVASGTKIVRAPFCAREECAAEIKAATGGFEARGTRLGEELTTPLKCFWCGSDAKKLTYFAKAY